MSEGSSYSAFPQGERGGGESERTVGASVGLAAPLGEVGFDGAKLTCDTDPALQYTASRMVQSGISLREEGKGGRGWRSGARSDPHGTRCT